MYMQFILSPEKIETRFLPFRITVKWDARRFIILMVRPDDIVYATSPCVKLDRDSQSSLRQIYFQNKVQKATSERTEFTLK